MSSIALAINDVVKTSIYCFEDANTAQVSINTQYWRVTGLSGAPAYSVQDVATKWDNNVAAAFKGILCNAATYRGVRANFFRPGPVGAYVSSVANAGNGTGGAGFIATQVSPVISFYTALGKQRGRNYLPFPSSAAMSGSGSPTAGYVTAALALLAIYGNGISLAGHGADTVTLTQVIYQVARPERLEPPRPARAEGFNEVARYAFNGKYGTQRRRGMYGRQNTLPF